MLIRTGAYTPYDWRKTVPALVAVRWKPGGGLKKTIDNFRCAPYIAVDNETGFRVRFYRLFDQELSSGFVSLERTWDV